MKPHWKPGRASRSAPRSGPLILALTAGALLLASCTVPVHTSAPTVVSAATAPLPGAPATSAVVVTVPDLATIATPGPTPGPGPRVSSAATPAPASSASPPGPPGSAVPPTAATTADTPTATASISSPPPTVAITLAGCAACAVLASHEHVSGDLSAALLSAGAGRAVLVSVRANGSVGGAVNITYGATFTTPAHGVLPCDDGRCVVVGIRSDGHAVASAWSLGSDGRWTDASIPGGFVSSSGSAQAVDLDGELGIAVQLGPSLWTTYAWLAQGYTVLGCESDPSAAPIASACPS